MTFPDGLGSGELKGLTVWVTGASRGLGKALTAGFVDAGAQVVASARDSERLESLADELGRESVLPVAGDVSSSTEVARMLETILAGHGSVDVLVNMAGISPTVVPSESLTDQQWQQIIDINLTGTFFCSRAVAPVMARSGGGSIINVSSVHGSVGVARMAAYAASKGGVETLTKSLAIEWAPAGIRVNCLAPGYFRTDLSAPYLDSAAGDQVRRRTPMGRVGDPAELVGAARFLAGPGSSYVTGSIVTVDGGWTAW